MLLRPFPCEDLNIPCKVTKEHRIAAKMQNSFSNFDLKACSYQNCGYFGWLFLAQKKKKKKLHHSSHIRLIRQTR